MIGDYLVEYLVLLPCGEVGKWGSGEVGKWGSGEVGKWGSGEVGKWGSCLITLSPYHPISCLLPPND
ncbi:hypothetical protein [Microcystis sp. M_QC_C_20170808_M3Col]|uniref:hypothetical protein n=1 Tax=Microcystis sp. M_QC_C_20170808_M3Col TaxID=2486216 RepID=UPI00257D6F8B|nr:hypothetical protein [Microcystis sp. M_QC_C_20170808_M3Col]